MPGVEGVNGQPYNDAWGEGKAYIIYSGVYKYKYLFSLLTSITDSAAFGKEITDLRKLFGNRVVVHLGKVLQHRDDYGARGAASLIKCEGGEQVEGINDT